MGGRAQPFGERRFRHRRAADRRIYFQGESRLQEKNLPVGELRRADRWPGGKNRLKQRLFYSGNFPCCSR